MFVSPELIEENESSIGMFLGLQGYFWTCSVKFES